MGSGTFRPPAHRLGVHRLTVALVLIQCAILIFDIVGYRVTGLTYAWTSAGADIALPLGLLFGWAYFAAWPGRQSGDWVTAEMFLLLALFFSISAIAPPGQYAAVAFKRPLIDPWLAAGDAMVGVHVPALAAWTSAQPGLPRVLLAAYLSLLGQFFVPLIVLGLWYRNRGALWEYAFHFHVCSAITMACLALWPVAGAFTYYGFEPSFDLHRFVEHFSGAYSGSLTTIRADDLEGLVSMPSFHVAGAVMVTWAMRQSRIWLAILLPLNLTLTAATVLTGTHYVTDLFGTAAMCAVSLWLYRRFAARWIDGTELPRLPRSGSAAAAGGKGSSGASFERERSKPGLFL